MNRNEIALEIARLESRKLACLGEMRASDPHAAKCQKLGLSFADEYPDEFARYRAANAEYHEADDRIAELREQLSKMPEEGDDVREPVPEQATE